MPSDLIPHEVTAAWDWLMQRAHHSQPLPAWVTLSLMLVVTAATLGKAWRVTQLPATLAHELGHAYVGKFTGRTVTGIKLSPDTSGVTHSAGKPNGIGYTLTVLAGYLTPPLVGVACAWSATNGWAGLCLFGLCVFLVLAAPLARNLLALTIMAATIVPSVYALSVNDTRLTTILIQSIGAYLGVAGLRATFSLGIAHNTGQGAGSDADQLRHLTLIPAQAWVFFYVVVAAVGIGAQVLFALDPHAL